MSTKKTNRRTFIPNEIWIEIFIFLHIKDILLSVSLVSKRWNQITTSDFLYTKKVRKKFGLDGFDLSRIKQQDLQSLLLWNDKIIDFNFHFDSEKEKTVSMNLLTVNACVRLDRVQECAGEYVKVNRIFGFVGYIVVSREKKLSKIKASDCYDIEDTFIGSDVLLDRERIGGLIEESELTNEIIFNDFFNGFFSFSDEKGNEVTFCVVESNQSIINHLHLSEKELKMLNMLISEESKPTARASFKAIHDIEDFFVGFIKKMVERVTREYSMRTWFDGSIIYFSPYHSTRIEKILMEKEENMKVINEELKKEKEKS